MAEDGVLLADKIARAERHDALDPDAVSDALFPAGAERRIGRGAISGSLPPPSEFSSAAIAARSGSSAASSDARFDRTALRGDAAPSASPVLSDASVASALADRLVFVALVALVALAAAAALGAFPFDSSPFEEPLPPAAPRMASTRSAFLRRVTPLMPIAPAIAWSCSRSLPSSIERSSCCSAIGSYSLGRGDR